MWMWAICYRLVDWIELFWYFYLVYSGKWLCSGQDSTVSFCMCVVVGLCCGGFDCVYVCWLIVVPFLCIGLLGGFSWIGRCVFVVLF